MGFEVLGAGHIKSLNFENIVVAMHVGKKFIAALIVSNAILIHYDILEKMVHELDNQLEPPEIVSTEDTERVEEIVRPLIEPILP